MAAPISVATQQGECQIWQTWWFIVGPKLPKAEIVLRKGIFLAPIDDAAFQEMKDFITPVANVSATTDSFVVHYPPRDTVQSRYRLQIDIEARNVDEAVQIAQAEAQKLITSLTLVIPERRYYAELRKLRILGENQERSRFSDTVTITPLTEPDSLASDDIERTLKLIKSIEVDPVAENAYVHLLSAWQLQMTAGSKPLARSILQHYVLCMEAVVNGVMEKVRKSSADRIRNDERRFAGEFAQGLSARADKPKAIREASTKLREISLSNMLPAISVVTPILALSTEVENLGKELYQFRSRNLSHPGRATREGLDRWLGRGAAVGDVCLADKVARAFFKGYCEKVSKST